MSKKDKQREIEVQQQHNDYTKPNEYKILKKKTIKELITPAGIDTSNIDHLEIISNVTKEFGKFSTPIVLQHDIKSFSVDAVEGILSYGVQNGYRFEAITMNTPLIQHRVNN